MTRVQLFLNTPQESTNTLNCVIKQNNEYSRNFKRCEMVPFKEKEHAKTAIIRQFKITIF